MGRLKPELTNRVAEARIAAGLTQEQLAESVDVSRQTIVAIEGGDYSPSTVLALRLSLVLDLPFDRLFELSNGAASEVSRRRQRLVRGGR
ncbi:MAG: hypothetical protein AUH85_08720 [Chloroflexi bacterium 13_1_40CM_4_68_4]|nr:MAG: hypothetical protein AUH85_08720 [Chloroflexi bacterium 13_1_40CM_4_68_4]